jgi:hypothetical protein
LFSQNIKELFTRFGWIAQTLSLRRRCFTHFRWFVFEELRNEGVWMLCDDSVLNDLSCGKIFQVERDDGRGFCTYSSDKDVVIIWVG